VSFARMAPSRARRCKAATIAARERLKCPREDPWLERTQASCETVQDAHKSGFLSHFNLFGLVSAPTYSSFRKNRTCS
jgi:hypothetical protein